MENGEKVVGVCSAAHISQILSRRFGLAIYGRRPIADFLTESPCIVEDTASLEHILKEVFNRSDRCFYDDVVLVDQNYCLIGVVGMLSLLGDTELNPDQLDFVKTGISSADSLLRIINDILDISKIEAGKLSITKSAFDPNEVIESCLMLFEAIARNQHLYLRLEGPAFPASVMGDTVRFRQILCNLISNGLKFTHVGGVIVERIICEDLGSVFTLALPFEVSDRIGAKDQGFDTKTKTGEASSQKADLHGSETSIGVEDQYVLIVEDNPVNQKVARQLLARLDCKADLTEVLLECKRQVHKSQKDHGAKFAIRSEKFVLRQN